jgi:hypothetical protein
MTMLDMNDPLDTAILAHYAEVRSYEMGLMDGSLSGFVLALGEAVPSLPVFVQSFMQRHALVFVPVQSVSMFTVRRLFPKVLKGLS